MQYFPEVKGKIRYEGPKSDNPLAFKYYNPRKKIGAKTMEQHLKFAVCYWHTFKGTGADPFGGGVYDRPWDAGHGRDGRGAQDDGRRLRVHLETRRKVLVLS